MLTDRRTDRRTSSIHKPELLCNPAKNYKIISKENQERMLNGIKIVQIQNSLMIQNGSNDCQYSQYANNIFLLFISSNLIGPIFFPCNIYLKKLYHQWLNWFLHREVEDIIWHSIYHQWSLLQMSNSIVSQFGIQRFISFPSNIWFFFPFIISQIEWMHIT